MAQKTLFAWRNCLLSPEGPSNPTTRLVLLTLSTHMSQEGERCFPTTRRLAEQTGLSHRSVLTHLELAVKEGWILKQSHGTNGQGWKRNQYAAIIPQRGEGGSPPLRGEGDSPALVERGEPDDINVVKEVHLNSKENSKPSTTRRTNGDVFHPSFEAAWALYPPREGGNSKRKAYGAWRKRLSEGVPEGDIFDGVQRYAVFIRATNREGTQFVKMASSFFGPDEWWKEPWKADDNGRPELAVL